MCLAPLEADYSVDTARLTKPVVGRGFTNLSDPKATATSASVPKFLVYRDRVFAYWVAGLARDVDHQMVNLSTRGMEIEMDKTGRFWGVGSRGKSVLSDDANSPTDPKKSRVTEVQDVRAIRDKVVALTGIGGSACVNSNSPVAGCSVAIVSLADAPLGENVFGRSVAKEQPLPVNPQQYICFIVGPDGKEQLLARFMPLGMNRGIAIERGLRRFAVPAGIP